MRPSFQHLRRTATLGGVSSQGLLATLALSAGQAQAQCQVNVYGVMGTQFVYATATMTVRTIDDSSIVNSRLGFEGEEDLGRRLNPNDSHLCGFFVCGGYAGFHNVPGFGHASAFIDNAVNYSTPGGMLFKASVRVAPSEGNARSVAGAGKLDLGPVTLAAAYDSQRSLAGGTSKLLLSAKAQCQCGFARLSYGKTDPAAGGAAAGTAWDIGGGPNLSPVATVSLDYVRHDPKDSANGANVVRLVREHQLSKRTRVNATLIRLNHPGASAIALAGATVAASPSQIVVTLGMVHSFCGTSPQAGPRLQRQACRCSRTKASKLRGA